MLWCVCAWEEIQREREWERRREGGREKGGWREGERGRGERESNLHFVHLKLLPGVKENQVSQNSGDGTGSLLYRILPGGHLIP